eukprot:5422821-Prymnesium_polylepis.1
MSAAAKQSPGYGMLQESLARRVGCPHLVPRAVRPECDGDGRSFHARLFPCRLSHGGTSGVAGGDDPVAASGGASGAAGASGSASSA